MTAQPRAGARLTLVSHVLCPYVQRAAIVLAEKRVDYQRIDIDLADKPEWFLRVSPLGKTPVLLVEDRPIFESAVICEYLEETRPPALHPDDPLDRAHHRAWIEFASAILNTIAGFYSASVEGALAMKGKELGARFEQVENVLKDGPYFAGDRFSLVDAAFGPVFRYFDVFEQEGISEVGFFQRMPKVLAWRKALRERVSVSNAVAADYPERLRAFLLSRGSALSARMAEYSQ